MTRKRRKAIAQAEKPTVTRPMPSDISFHFRVHAGGPEAHYRTTYQVIALDERDLTAEVVYEDGYVAANNVYYALRAFTGWSPIMGEAKEIADAIRRKLGLLPPAEDLQ